MSGQPAIVRDPTAIDEAAWRRLWAGYGAFCETRVPDTMTARTWQRMLDPLSPIFGRRHRSDDRRLYVAVLHEGTWTIAPICYLEDLFVEPGRHRAID
jgi:hypothetical protein